MSLPRSYLFVPGHRPDRFAKAAASGAHRIILDLEDAVGSSEKAEARQHAVRWFADGGSGLLRINGADTEWFEDDLTAAAGCPQAEIMVPKAEARSLARVAQRLGDRPHVALVETVAGLLGLRETATAPCTARLAFGSLDFSVDARMADTDAVLDPARFQIAIHSRHAGLPPPIDGITADFRNAGELAADLARARSLGFTAKLCIHPAQIEAVNRELAPSADEIDWAQRIVAAIGESRGAAVQVDGKMVDRPVLERARAIIEAGGVET